MLMSRYHIPRNHTGGVGSATCLNGALLCVSRGDHTMYIERGAGLNARLTDERINKVSVCVCELSSGGRPKHTKVKLMVHTTTNTYPS